MPFACRGFNRTAFSDVHRSTEMTRKRSPTLPTTVRQDYSILSQNYGKTLGFWPGSWPIFSGGRINCKTRPIWFPNIAWGKVSALPWATLPLSPTGNSYGTALRLLRLRDMLGFG